MYEFKHDESAILHGAEYFTNPWLDELFYFKFKNDLWYYFYNGQWFIADQKEYTKKFKLGLMKVIQLC